MRCGTFFGRDRFAIDLFNIETGEILSVVDGRLRGNDGKTCELYRYKLVTREVRACQAALDRSFGGGRAILSAISHRTHKSLASQASSRAKL